MTIAPRPFAVIASLAILTICGCAPNMRALPPRDNGDPWDKIVSACPPQPTSIHFPDNYKTLRAGVPIPVPMRAWRPPHTYPNPPRGKIYPDLLKRILAHPHSATRETLLISFRENLTLTRFPALVDNEPRSSPTNQARLLAARARIADIQARRDSSYLADSTDLVRHFGARIHHRHWLTHSLLVDMPIAEVQPLATRPTVVYIQPRVGKEGPPVSTCTSSLPACPTGASAANNSDDDDPIVARQLIQSDAYRNLGLGYGHMSLLDSGVWPDHKLLSGVTLGVSGDCIVGGVDCLTTSAAGFDASDMAECTQGHGTSTAALLVGNTGLGDRFQGALDITLDQFRVFVPSASSRNGLALDADAAATAFESAMSNLDRIIVADLSSETPDRAAVAMSANNAYALGAVVIAANGDAGPTGLATSPATAPCVLGVGARDLLGLSITDPTQSIGPASGGRIKPDIQAPTGAETAEIPYGTCSRNDLLHTHASTSGSTPFAAAAAALLRNWMKAGGEDIDPGAVYAAMILAGRHYGGNLNNTEGAGMIELPTDGCSWWGAGLVWEGGNWQVPLTVDATTTDSLEVALWWPEQTVVASDGEGLTRHNDVDLDVYDPTGALKASSRQTGSVFERTTAALDKQSGAWTIVLRGVDFYDPKEFQTVYWAAAARVRR